MQQNVIIAGVGGQGILTIAEALSLAALRRDWRVKQAEVHGMSQRGGAVQSHLRISDAELYSDLISRGQADVVLSMEPLESLRYVEYLREGGTIVANTTPFVNIPNYPVVEEVLERIGRLADHVLIDADRLARFAGSARAVNAVMLGAGSVVLGIDQGTLEEAMAEMFAAKGRSVIDINQRALRLGRQAARLYTEALRCGATPRAVRHWLDHLPPADLEQPGKVAPPSFGELDDSELSEPEARAVTQLLEGLAAENRRQLYEHEVYELVELVGAIRPPQHRFVHRGSTVSAEDLAAFPGERVVLKIVSTDIVHKTEAGAVRFVPNELDVVNAEIRAMVERHSAGGARIAGVLLVEFVEPSESGFGQELFVGIRASREFGAIMAAGLGGVDTEYLAHRMRPGAAVAKALAGDTTAEEFFELFQKTAAYDVIAGRARGHRRVVSDGELLRCFRAFLALAKRFCVYRGDEGPSLRELEVNPFAFVRQRLVPLDGRAQVDELTRPAVSRPIAKIGAMLEPQSIAVVGVSSKRENFGRIILDNIRACGFPPDQLWVIKPGSDSIDGVRCAASVGALPAPVDLLVIAAASGNIAPLMDEVTQSGKVASVILIPGGLGETESSAELAARLREVIVESRRRPDRGPVVLGGNCLGVRSRPGRYDTFFVPAEKLAPRRGDPSNRLALLTQSGAFVITRISNLETVNPAFAITFGNQLDLTASDLLRALADRTDVDVIGAYVEGFSDLDGLAFVRAVEDAVAAGKVVVFYKAGKTESGRSATAGHTASIAGDYDVCQTVVAQAGAIVTDTFKEFEQVVEIATLFHGFPLRGRRIGCISNAGFETVGMADGIQGARYELELAQLADATRESLAGTMARAGLGALVNVRNPLDLNPMADEEVYQESVRALLEDPQVDAVVVSIVPFTPRLQTTVEELAGPARDALMNRFPALMDQYQKPLIVVVDAGRDYELFARGFRQRGVAVYPSCDQAMRSLGRYVYYRTRDRGRLCRPACAGAKRGSAAAELPLPVASGV
ncbi:MAG: indolepyruvate oxidoreductase subunit beta [Planctomycetes bacterium]|nr:indolepyruvate oxidoreductase subunit beta [Planctomycetota bacterium]